MKGSGGLTRRQAKCPECRHIFTITYRPDVRYFQAPKQECPECGFVSRRAAFKKPTLEDYES